MSDYNVDGKVMSDETAAIVIAAIKDLHVALGGGMPSFDRCGYVEQRVLLGRAYNSLEETAKANRANVVKAAKAGVDAVISKSRADVAAASAELAKLSPAARQLLGVKPLPENILIGLSEVQSCFPQGTSESDMVKALHDMGYQLAKGAKGDKGVRLSIPMKEKAAPSPTPANAVGIGSEDAAQ